MWSSRETLVIINSMNKSEALTCKIELHRNSEQKKTTKPCKTRQPEILRIMEIQNKFKTNLKKKRTGGFGLKAVVLRKEDFNFILVFCEAVVHELVHVVWKS